MNIAEQQIELNDAALYTLSVVIKPDQLFYFYY
jgi:hypothetical protein